MTSKLAAAVWKETRDMHLDSIARFIPRGALAGEHVVEIEPGHAVTTDGFKALLELCQRRTLNLSYGLSPRRVVVIS